jgi:hypothetical protein
VLRLVGRRAVSLAGHARRGDSAAVLGIAAATLELPRAALLAAARRRRPWDGARLAGWLAQARQDVQVERLSPRRDRRPRASPDARGASAPGRARRRG